MTKNASVICIGNELLSGETIDTNKAWLGRELTILGIPLSVAFTIRDDVDVIADTIALAAAQSDIILITGGLGPTDDDVTREGLAKYLGVELELHPEQLKVIEDFFKARGSVMAEKNKCQAYLPAGTEFIENPLGTAPGILSKCEGKIIACMPGVPSEMKNMFHDSVKGVFSDFGKQQSVVVRKLKCTGAGESTIAQALGDEMLRGRNPLVNCTCHGCVITLHVIATAENADRASAMADEKVGQLNQLLGGLNLPGGVAFGFDDDTLEGVVGKELTKRSKTVALAESCTGGLIAKMLTDAPGASEFFKYGWVTYANEAKVSQLGVSPDLIETYGAVSSQVAEAMAIGARQKAGADFGVAVTGIAGPDGGTKDKPVGLVYIAVAGDNDIVAECQCVIEKCVFGGSRADIRLRTAMKALNMLRCRLVCRP